MKKDFAKKHTAKQSKIAKYKKWFWAVSISLSAILACGMGFFFWQPKHTGLISSLNSPLISNRISSYHSSINHWIAERKTQLHDNFVNMKKIAVNRKDAKQEIHFEFYTALQNMQVTSAVIDKPVNTQPVLTDEIPAKKVIRNQTIFDADKLQLALKDEFNQFDKQTAHSDGQYIIQMGVFRNAAGAEKFRVSFTKSGFTAKSVRITAAGKEAYSVRIGPFLSKNQALLAQRQLQKKSAGGIIMKTKS